MENLTKRERVFMAIATLWLFVNIIIYFMSKPMNNLSRAEAIKINNIKSILYPFGITYHYSDEKFNYTAWHSITDVYDFTELLVYGISPFVLFFIYKMFLKTNK